MKFEIKIEIDTEKDQQELMEIMDVLDEIRARLSQADCQEEQE